MTFFLSMLIGVVLGALGGGGAVLAMPILLYVAKVSAREAIVTSLIVVGATSAVGAFLKAREGDVRVKQGLLFAGGGVLGALGGVRVASHVPSQALIWAFALLMLASAGLLLRPVKVGAPAVRAWLVIPVGVFSGALTGAVGAGGGFIIVPALVLLLGVPMREAVGTSLLVIMLQSFVGAAEHLRHSNVEVDTGLAAGMATVAGAGVFLGHRFSRSLPVEALRRGFAFLLFAAAIYMLAHPPKSDSSSEPSRANQLEPQRP